jgi:hypothetical protein
MGSHAIPLKTSAPYSVHVSLAPALEPRNRLTAAFRWILAIPHLLIVGAPIGLALTWSRTPEGGVDYAWGAGAGVLGAVAAVCALIAWFAIVFTGRSPEGLATLSAFYLRWHVRASAYVTLLRDEYPPFGDGEYAAAVELPMLTGERDRLSVALRPITVIPHILIVWLLGLAWGVTTLVAWFAILFTGRYPAALYEFAVGVLRWTTRVEAYLLLLTDDYPPFTLD